MILNDQYGWEEEDDEKGGQYPVFHVREIGARLFRLEREYQVYSYVPKDVLYMPRGSSSIQSTINSMLRRDGRHPCAL